MSALNNLPADNFFVKQVRSSNSQLVVLNVLLLAGVIAVALSQSRYLYNFFHQPEPASWTSLAAITDPALSKHFYVTVKGSTSIDTGIQEMEYKGSRTDRPGTLKASFFLLKVGPKLLLVRSPAGEKETIYTGTLTATPQHMQQSVSDMQKRYPMMSGMMLPYILDTDDFRFKGYPFIALGSVLFLVGLWNLAQCARRQARPDRHPIVRALAKYGEPAQVAAAIDAEIGKAGYKRRGVSNTLMLTDSWLLIKRTFGMEIIALPDLMWMHMKTTQHSVNFVPVGKSFEAILYTRDGRSHNIAASPTNVRTSVRTGYQANIEQILQEFSRSAPWAILGYSNETEQVWKTQRAYFIATVDERRQRFLAHQTQATQTTASGPVPSPQAPTTPTPAQV